jgi:kynurenine formamidase/glyoxylase-like metal-dependent hydrolase (beta-lactamase superfamily II)
MKIKISIILFLWTLSCYGQKTQRPHLDISVYRGSEVMENAFLIRDRKNFTLIDALGSEDAAQQIVRDIVGKTLNTIFITHAHPDHFLGLATILKEHPESAVYVANEDIKQDILRYVNQAMAKGLLDRVPTMKPKSDHSEGFNYEKIKIINGDRLEVGSGNYLTVEIIKDAAESAHNSILYHEQLNLLFASDLLYNNVYNWLGQGVDQAGIENWINTIENLKSRFGNERMQIFPGHGEKSDHSLYDKNINYLRSFQKIICRSTSRSDAKAFFNLLYPNHKGEFLLTRSIDHWIDSCSMKRSSISITNIQDLTHTLTPNFPFIPVPGITFPFGIKPIATMEKNGVRANQWIIHEHLGTQIDAPNHFTQNGIALEKLDVKDLLVPVIVIDISEKSSQNSDAILTVEDIKTWETKHGRVPDNACVMMYSGWEHFLYSDKYLGLDKSHTKHFPGISSEAIHFLTTERTISGVGVDVISFDPGYDNEYKGHKLLFSANKWAVEAVANLKMIPEKGAWLFVGAPKVEGATGGIVRLLAVWE